eukprot:CAMPEP_0184368642 /NCGR_PEP_ID=MMETSP1089-20130417/161781_1 /TAXON_ID=38269 ORGANISM="Gloeochaete wittrockiana, Strain SAG46.84" /NCGR_SAMPLE_ID=MMETSP1089 /ASSEMBLY_ACC=CAM_ASM_000445 /LENGTH=303 /DNA_ID=CAMNT_0026710959 /DNA_START=103 /DNA_END=1014 /DNA_ORIENTATION=+
MNPVADAETIHKSFKFLGNDNNALISAIGNKSIEHMKAVDLAYKANFGKSLIDVLKKETSGNFGKALIALCRSHADNDAHTLNDALEGGGMDEKTVIEVLCARNNAEIRDIIAAYKQIFNKNLEDVLKAQSSGSMKILFVMLLTANRSEVTEANAQEVATDVEELYKAGKGRIGTNETPFLRIFTQRSVAQLRAVDAAYCQKTGSTLKRVVEKEFSGDIKRSLSTMLDYLMDRGLHFAELIESSVKGAGSSDTKLIRNVAHLRGPLKAEVEAAYMRKYSKSIAHRIKADTSGDYRKLLLTVVE